MIEILSIGGAGVIGTLAAVVVAVYYHGRAGRLEAELGRERDLHSATDRAKAAAVRDGDAARATLVREQEAHREDVARQEAVIRGLREQVRRDDDATIARIEAEPDGARAARMAREYGAGVLSAPPGGGVPGLPDDITPTARLRPPGGSGSGDGGTGG